MDAVEAASEEVLNLLNKIDEADEAVGAAYGMETCDRNGPEDCKRHIRAGQAGIRPGERDECFVRRMVRDHHDPEALPKV